MVVGLVLWWWLVTTVLGIGALGLTFGLLRSLPARGVFVARYLGMLLAGYGVWLVASMQVIPYSQGLALMGAGVLVLAGGWRLWVQRGELVEWFAENRTALVIGEVLYLGSFLFFAWMRSYMPEIEGTEKLPDMCFIAATYTTEFFPPHDTWAHGLTINYFYFSHYLVGFLCKLSGVTPYVGYNLGLAQMYAFFAINAYGLVFNLTKKSAMSLFGPLFIVYMGNLDGFFQKIVEGNPGYNWWRSSRVMVRQAFIDGKWQDVDVTINEFPMWSFILGDMHAHMMAGPLLLLNLVLMLHMAQAVLWRREDGQGGTPVLRIATLGVLLSVCFGATPAANFWELPTIAIALFTMAFLRVYKSEATTWKERLLQSAKDFGFAAIVFVGMFVAYLPFHLNFQRNQTSGIGFLPASMRSYADDYFTIHGFFFFMLVSFLAYVGHRELRKPGRTISVESVAAVVGMLGVAGYSFQSLPLFVTVSCFVVLLILAFTVPFNMRMMFTLAITGIALGMLIGTEFVFIKDTYGGSLRRMNTIFKFYFQTWILLGATSAVFAGMLLEHFRKQKHWLGSMAWVGAFVMLIGAGMLFTFSVPASRTGNWRLRGETTLSGIAFLERSRPGDYAGVRKVLEVMEPDEVLLEATGEAFSMYGRISAYTGRPAILGWGHHQGIWRAYKGIDIPKRENDIKRMYQTQNVQEFQRIADEYSVDYVWVGSLERQRYGQDGLGKFAQVGELILDEAGSQLYRLR